MDAIVLLGAPGAGKGTAAEDVQKSTTYIHVSTGNMLRDAIASGSPVGDEAHVYMERGELVPDEVIARIVRDRLDQGAPDARYMFDGFPRTEKQAQLLDEIVEERNGKVRFVFLLEVERQILLSRLAGRRICRECGAVFHVTGKRPRREGVCDECGSELYQRKDDNEETILNRLEVYRKQTESLIDYYASKGVLVRVDAEDRRETEKAIQQVLERADA